MRGWWVAVLLGAAFAGCSAQGGGASLAGTDGFEPIESAGWKAGFHFVHSVEGDVRMEGSFTAGGETDHLDEHESFGPEPVADYTVVSTTITNGAEPMYVALGRDLFFDEPFLMGFRQRDLQPVEVIEVVDGSFRFEAPPETYPWVRFPLEPGDEWSGEFVTETLFGSNITFRVESRVEGLETVDGPSGPVEAVRIRHDIDIDTEAVETQMRETMEASGSQDVEVDFSGEATDLVYYAPSLHNVVLDDTEVSMAFHGSSRDFGQRSEVEMEMTVRAAIRLTEAQFEEEADLDAVEVTELLEEGGLPDAGGGFQGGSGGSRPDAPPENAPDLGTLTVVADTEAPNAAEATLVSFLALPDDGRQPASVEMFLFDALGSRVAMGEDTLEHTFNEPGLFRIEAFAFDEEETLIATGSLEYPVGWMAELAATCDELVAADLGACEGWDLPVRPGVASLTAQATPGGPVPVHLGGTLRLFAPSGEERTAALQDGVAFLSWESPGLVAAEAEGDWHLIYTPDPGVLETVTYAVSLTAGEAGVPDDSAPPSAGGGLVALKVTSWLEQGWAKTLRLAADA
ncbi:MAG TPA: hypothetical protein VI796_05560 [Candidatus Thermoplasmatota archaeon]|nr:hypothetical protein [Candidatus Thermoplasmatota archaeon]